MTKCTTIHKHGPDPKYMRSVVPQNVIDALELSLGDVFKWEIIDKQTVMLRLV